MDIKIEKYTEGDYSFEEYYLNGEYHRTDGPAHIQYKDGIVIEELWFENGEYHRTDGPAIKTYNESGEIQEESWFKHGQYHRTDGPAFNRYKHKKLMTEIWLLGGIEIPTDWIAIYPLPENIALAKLTWI